MGPGGGGDKKNQFFWAAYFFWLRGRGDKKKETFFGGNPNIPQLRPDFDLNLRIQTGVLDFKRLRAAGGRGAKKIHFFWRPLPG